MPDVLLIEPCDLENFPKGGQLSFARQLLSVFGNRLAVVGITTDSAPTGRWIKKDLAGVECDFFAIGRRTPSPEKPVVPARLAAYLQLKRYKKQILSLGIRAAYVQAPEVLMAVQDWGWDSVCCRCPGLVNPLIIPRYIWAKLFARSFFRRWVTALTKCDVILAAADDKMIDAFVDASEGKLPRDRIVTFPTRVDTTVFRPMDKATVREQLNVDPDVFLVAHCGRINAVKGWEFLIDSFDVVCQTVRNAALVFIGDGEDRRALQNCVEERGLRGRVQITGFLSPSEVVKWMNAADVVAVASHHEGWCTAMLEALACGKPVVSTNVSGAEAMVRDGENGFVVKNRDPRQFADALMGTPALRSAREVSLDIVGEYALEYLAVTIGRHWRPLA